MATCSELADEFPALAHEISVTLVILVASAGLGRRLTPLSASDLSHRRRTKT
jgi:hypothetical protein